MKEVSIQEKDSIEYKFVDKITSRFHNEIIKIFFFGSRAKGISQPESDYDFLIILQEKDKKTVDGIYDVVTDFLIKYGVDISLKIYRDNKFQEMASIPTPFMASVLKTGKEVWSRI